jgi:hypothetical protein
MFYTTGRAAEVLPKWMGMTRVKIAQLFDEGKLWGFKYSDGGRWRRSERHIDPHSLIEYVKEKWAKRLGEERLEKLIAVIKTHGNASRPRSGDKLTKASGRSRKRHRLKVCYYFADPEAARGPVWVQRARLVAG